MRLPRQAACTALAWLPPLYNDGMHDLFSRKYPSTISGLSPAQICVPVWHLIIMAVRNNAETYLGYRHLLGVYPTKLS